ncbi:MAG TPA: transglycosylase domain-containing protein, partial [Candidatus Eisenbacteria bacterium]|nr:transglycosylase domain-containing protein [Candidatus Eisenbacteria bacterium]
MLAHPKLVRTFHHLAPRDRRLLIACLALAALVIGAVVPFVVRVQALNARRASGPSWSFPSHIYSDGVPLVAGRVLPRDALIAELEARGYREVAGTPGPGTWRASGGGLDIGLAGFRDARDPAGAGGPERVHVALDDSVVTGVDRRGGYPGSARPDLDHPPRLEPAPVAIVLGGSGVRRTWVALDRVPPAVWGAIVASEDRRFFTHPGVDPRGALRALFANLHAGQVRQGGSTLSQQLARGWFLGSERTLARKLAELPLAFALELLLGKRAILEDYLNMVYWGQADGGAVGGIAEAARWYFDAPVESLRVEQGALLAALIPAPNALEPFDHPDEARARRDAVLRIMADTRRLTRGQADSLAALPLRIRRGPAPLERFPSYVDHVRDALDRELGPHAAESWGLSVFTTLDLPWQASAETALARGLARFDPGASREPLQGAFVALEPGTAAIRALVGGRHPASGEFDRATQARRQTGSAIKPIVYAAALSEASVASFTPASTVPDERRTFGSGRWAWAPRNDNDSYHPTVTFAEALARSINVATANVVEQIGPSTVARYAAAFGLGKLKPVMSIGLGTNDVSLLDLTGAYAVFADGGMHRAPSPLRAVVSGDGRIVAGTTHPGQDVIPEGIAALMTGLLEDVALYGVAAPLRYTFGYDRPVAGKTGTTNDFHDAWFVGYTPYIVAGVWVGYDTPKSLGDQAAHVALPIWASIVKPLTDAYPPTPFASDASLEWHLIDPWTGLLADQGACPGMWVPFLPGTAPTTPCGGAAAWEGAALDT